LPGPTGERNTLAFANRGLVLCAAGDIANLLNQLAAVFATGNRALVQGHDLLAGLPAAVMAQLIVVDNLAANQLPFQVALVDRASGAQLAGVLAAGQGALVSLIDTTANQALPLWRLVAERALCVNTTAAGGNASLMTLGL